MEFSAKQIAEILKGTVEGDENAKVSTLSKIEEGKLGSLSFLANPQYTPYIYTTEATIVIVNQDFVAEKPISATLLRVENAYNSFATLLDFYNQYRNQKSGIDAKAIIAESATIGTDVYIGANAVISENVKIGNNVKIYPNTYIGDNAIIGEGTIIYSGVNVYHESVIGANCTLHSGVVIGADGFGFAPQDDNNYRKVAQIGNVILEDNVEIGANTTVDRATLGSTIVRKGVKLDNLVQIAHNVEVGENTVIAAQTGIAGSTKIGKNCMIGGQVGIVGHLTIADGVMIAAQTGVASSLKEPKSIWQGSPAIEINSFRKSYVLFKKLPEIYKTLLDLRKA